MSIHSYSRTDKVTVSSMYTDLVLRVTGFDRHTRPYSKDIVSKPQFVINFQRDVDLLLDSDIIDKCLQTKAESV